MSEKRIVIWSKDPDDIGSIIEASREVVLAEMRAELATLPVDERLLNIGPIHGYFRRDWGRPGVAFRDRRPARECPMLIWVTPDLPYLHFAARVVFDKAQGRRPKGVLQLSAAVMPSGTFVGGIGAVGMRGLVLDELHADGGDEVPSWILRGRVGVSVQTEGYLGCCLNAVAEGVRVTWTAVTQSSQEQ